MEEKKHFLASKTVWASLLQLLLAVALVAGWVTPEQSSRLLELGPEVLASAASGVLAIVALYGRVTAKTFIGKKPSKIT